MQLRPRPILLLACTSTLLAAAPPAPLPAAFMQSSTWNRGDVFRFTAVKTVTREDAGNQVSQTKVKYTFEIRVIKDDPDGPILEWSMKDFTVIEPRDLGDASDFAKMNVIQFRLPSDGSAPTLDNPAQFAASQIALYDKSIQSKPPDERKTLHDAYAATLLDPKNRRALHTSALSDPSLLHAFNGVPFLADAKPVATKSPLPGLNVDIAGTTTHAIVRQNRESVTVRQAFKSDADAGKVLAKALADAERARGGKAEIPADLDVSLIVTTEAQYNRRRTLPLGLRFENASRVATKSEPPMVQSTLIEIVDADLAAKAPATTRQP